MALKKSALTLTAIFFSGCTMMQKKQFVNAATGLKEYSHIQIGCRILDYGGNLVFFAPGGEMCVFNDDGSYIISRANGPVVKVDKRRDIVWQLEVPLNHILEKAKHSDDILSLGDQWETINGKRVRFDRALVIGQDGRIKKSFAFKKYVDDYKVKYEPVSIPNASAENSLELTHFNSIAGVYQVKDNMPTLIGYVANDRNSKQAFFLNSEMSQITSVWDFENRAVHSVIAVDAQKFIYYMNEDSKVSDFNNPDFHSRIEQFDIESGKTTVIWENKSKALASKMGSSVQLLSSDALFLFHAPCPICSFSEHKPPAVELAFVKQQKSYSMILDPVLGLGLSASLINARSFLENQNY